MCTEQSERRLGLTRQPWHVASSGAVVGSTDNTWACIGCEEAVGHYVVGLHNERLGVLCSNPVVGTFSGRTVNLMQPDPSQICVEDIARSLSMQCRWNGHVRSFYSVAEHCVRCSDVVPPEAAAWALMHDAAEAYIGDIPTPVKRMLPEAARAEERLLLAIAEALGLTLPIPDEAWWADQTLTSTECRDLAGRCYPVCECTHAPLTEPIRLVATPRQAELLFLRRWDEVRP